MKIAIRLATLLAVLVTALEGNADTIRGRVVNEDGEPMRDARWRVTGYENPEGGIDMPSGRASEGRTDAEGRFEIEVSGRQRYDLLFDHDFAAPAFLYRISGDTKDLVVTLRKGYVVRGRIVRSDPAPESSSRRRSIRSLVTVTLPNGRGTWYRKEVFTDFSGRFECRVDSAPTPPSGSPGRWQVQFAGEVVELGPIAEEAKEEIVFEIQVRARRATRDESDR